MSAPFDHRDPGTAEARWRDSAPWAQSPELDGDADRVIVVAAHPDDETLGAGGLLWTAARAGADVSVIVATDGEAADSDRDAAELAVARRQELVAALRELAPAARVRFLGLPDGGLDARRDDLARAVTTEIGSQPWRVLLVAPWQGDGHRDHRIAGEVAAACAQPGVRVAEYPVWLWHWGDPETVDTAPWQRLALGPDARVAKARALGAHRSQLEGDPPLLHAGMRAHFGRDVEVFVASAPPPRAVLTVDDFEEKFRRSTDPWGFRTRWYERRKRAILLASLPRERFENALELGCANGELTADLAARSTHIVAVDAAAEALRVARERVRSANVRFEHHVLPGHWPEAGRGGAFDLVVVSEIAYYWTADDLVEAIARIDASLSTDGVLVVCHWRHETPDAAVSGDAVHAAFDAAPGWTRALRHLEEDFVLDVHVRAGTPSVARAEASL